MTIRIITGDCRAVLPTLAPDSFDCIVTSPPYFGLRDYGVDGQIGLEPTLQEYLEKMVAVCRELRRVLKPSGSFWLNLGDSYARAPGKGQHKPGDAGKQNYIIERGGGRAAGQAIPEGLKGKDLMMVPSRLAIALQQPWYAGKIKDVADRVWLAAMIDAEGCMYIHKRKAGTPAYSKFTKADGTEMAYVRTQDSYAPGLEIANTSIAIIERCMAIAGGIGSISTQSPEQNMRRKQTIFRWHLRSDECKRLVQEIYPHLVGKQQQARILLGCPSSGDSAAAGHSALIDLHNGKFTDVDFKAPASLYEEGWFVRSEIVWKKPNPMPESVVDRPTSSHEKVWLLAKSGATTIWRAVDTREWSLKPDLSQTVPAPTDDEPDAVRARWRGFDYFYDQDAIREGRTSDEDSKTFRGGSYVGGKTDNATMGKRTIVGNRKRGVPPRHAEYESSDQSGLDDVGRGDGRNARNVWTIATRPFKGSHFATFPPDLVERCIKAGCPPGGHVIDPFGGAGTTGMVADRLGRDATMIELNPAYGAMAGDRARADSPLFAQVTE